jgi:hypothetical protein
MAWRPVVIPVVHTPDSKWDGVGKGINRNAARVEAGGAGALSVKDVQLEKSPIKNPLSYGISGL